MAESRSPWLPFDVPPGSVRMYCLPHAGASASVYRSWFGKIGGVSVCPVQLPGRETRLREPLYHHLEELVRDLAGAVLAAPPGPYAVYGHSMGGLVGFELLREIRRRGGPDPVHLFVSGCPAPDAPPAANVPRVTGLNEEQVVAVLSRLGGTPAWMLADASVRRMILPPFRADFAVKETYQFRPQPPLAVPITAIVADGDSWNGVSTVAGWRDQTSRGFQLRTISGGHFAVLEQAPVTHAHIAEALRPWTGTAAARPDSLAVAV